MENNEKKARKPMKNALRIALRVLVVILGAAAFVLVRNTAVIIITAFLVYLLRKPKSAEQAQPDTTNAADGEDEAEEESNDGADSDISSDEDEEETSGKYPAWEWVNTYAKNNALSGEYAQGWYIPTLAELCMLYRAKDIVNAALETAGGTEIADTGYWSSSQGSSLNFYAWFVRFDAGTLVDCYYKGYNLSVCGVRAFN